MKKFAGHLLTFVRESSKLYRILTSILAIVVKILPLNIVFMSTHFPVRGQFSIKVFGSKKISKNYELFARYDQISSNIISGEANAWNYNNDGSLVMFGTQYQATKGVKFNLNYKLFNYNNSLINNKSILSLNAEFKI